MAALFWSIWSPYFRLLTSLIGSQIQSRKNYTRWVLVAHEKLLNAHGLQSILEARAAAPCNLILSVSWKGADLQGSIDWTTPYVLLAAASSPISTTMQPI
jgi:hypothetical protein